VLEFGFQLDSQNITIAQVWECVQLFFSLASKFGSVYLNYGHYVYITNLIVCQWYFSCYTASFALIFMTFARLHTFYIASAVIFQRKCITDVAFFVYRI
jgi:hypothetical protein